MTFHSWGDEDFDFGEFDKVIDFMGSYLRKRRVPVRDVKEKFGQARIYLSFGYSNLHDFLYPGYAYCQYKHKWIWHLDCQYGSKVMWLVNFIAIPLHQYWYRRAHELAIKKWPQFRKEILAAPDYHELLEDL